MYRIITALTLLTISLIASANTMSGAMLGSQYPQSLMDGSTVNLGGGSASTGCTVSSSGDFTCSGDMTMNGQDLKTAATGSADDFRIQPAGATNLTVTEAGAIQINKVVTVHAACAALGDVGKLELYSVADTISLCLCWQSGAATFGWVPIPTGGAC